MYRKDSEGWLKHADFIVLDLLCLQISFILAYVLSGYGWNPYHIMLYRNMSIFLELADLLVIFCYDTMKGVLKKGYYRDFVVTLKHSIMVGGLAILYLFLLQQGGDYSRLALFLTILLYTGITYFVRELRKKSLKKQMQNGGERSLLIITSGEVARRVVDNMKENNYARFRIAGVSVIDEDWIGRKVEDIPVVANEETTPKYVCKEWSDEVLIVISDDIPYPTELIRKLSETGVTIHLNLTKVTNIPGKKQFVEKVGVYTVLTTSINYASAFQLALKRMMDIAGGLVGCFLTVIIFLFVAPAIYIASPGPIFFSQERVGKNGRKFKIYKFRSMYIDAEERKAELMDENKLGDGKMFKMDFDPRVIGNKVLPDGTHKTGIGDFIRRTSLDEFPQFFNVLKGDMSIVGTRPPLISETNLYELHHRVRLAIKPGITGMWQVSGRSDITDFEEVVRLDKEYISKAMMEHVIFANARVAAKRGGTVICCTRYGNVMCSRGSVIPLFIDQIKNKKPITVTDPNMTRFLMNLDEAVDLVRFAFEHANPGDLFIQKADASTIGDLAKAVQKLFGDTGINVIGTRHGEKLYETLMTREERLRSEDMGGYYRVAADSRDLNYDKFVVHGEVHTMADESYTSHNTNRLDVEETINKILTTDYVKEELKGIRHN